MQTKSIKLTRACERCGTTFYRYPSQMLEQTKYCSRACHHLSKAKPAGSHGALTYKATFLPDHPLAPPSGMVQEHRANLYAKIGPGPHLCHWCGKTLTWQVAHRPNRTSISVDHLDGVRRNNDSANLVPSCQGCNAKRGNTSLVGDDETFVIGGNGNRNRTVPHACDRCGATHLILAYMLKTGRRGRFCSRACQRAYSIERANAHNQLG